MKTFNGVYDRKPGRSAKPKKYVPTEEELANDPSLMWVPYRRWEPIWSDDHGANLRFVEYVGDLVKLASLDGISELPGLVKKLGIRRLTSR